MLCCDWQSLWAELTNQKSAVAVIAEAVQSIVECHVSDAGNISSSSSNVSGGGVQSKYAEMSAMLLEVETVAKNKLGSLLLQLRLVGLSSLSSLVCSFFSVCEHDLSKNCG